MGRLTRPLVKCHRTSGVFNRRLRELNACRYSPESTHSTRPFDTLIIHNRSQTTSSCVTYLLTSILPSTNCTILAESLCLLHSDQMQSAESKPPVFYTRSFSKHYFVTISEKIKGLYLFDRDSTERCSGVTAGRRKRQG